MAAAAPTWDPGQYLRHAEHRARPFADLLARVPALPADPARIADLGCGPGNATTRLAERWPTARITGYDNSPEMLARAEEHAGATAGGGSLDFAHADLTAWAPAETYDLIVSNAALHWVPGHLDAFAGWLDAVAPGGTFAFQVPHNIDAPLHSLMRELAASARWRERLDGVLREEHSVHAPTVYLDRLTRLGCEADVWETTYLQVLQGGRTPSSTGPRARPSAPPSRFCPPTRRRGTPSPPSTATCSARPIRRSRTARSSPSGASSPSPGRGEARRVGAGPGAAALGAPGAHRCRARCCADY
jgi:trans-aconitate 2-methyltransferase